MINLSVTPRACDRFHRVIYLSFLFICINVLSPIYVLQRGEECPAAEVRYWSEEVNLVTPVPDAPSPQLYCVLLYNVIMRIFCFTNWGAAQGLRLSDRPQYNVGIKTKLQLSNLTVCSEQLEPHTVEMNEVKDLTARTEKTSDLAGVSGSWLQALPEKISVAMRWWSGWPAGSMAPWHTQEITRVI